MKKLETHVLLVGIIIIAAIMTHIIPAGSFSYVEIGGRNVVIADSFHLTSGDPVGVWDVFRAFPYGLYTSGILIAGLYCIGGFGAVLIETKVIDTVIVNLLQMFRKGSKDMVLIACFYFFSVLGAFLGLIDVVIPFVPIMLGMAVKLGYDTKTGIATAILGAMSGFMAGPTNPLTTGIGQEVAGITMFSGFAYRMAIYFMSTSLTVCYILYRAHQNVCITTVVRSDKEPGMVTLSRRYIAILITLVGSILFFVIGTIQNGWGNLEMATVLFIDSILFGILDGMSQKKWIAIFTDGAAKMTGAAILIGLASGVEWILKSANVLDTIVYGLLGKIRELHPILIILLLFLIILVVNFLIPSASGKAVLVMPMLIPIAQVSGFTEQTAVLIYQFGDGITKMCFPTVGPLLAVLALGDIGFGEWARYVRPLIVFLGIMAVIFLISAYCFQYS